MGCKMRAAGNCGQAGSAWRRGIVKGDKLSPLTEVLIRGNWNLREICETAVRHLENIKNSEKQKSKKDSKTIRTTQPPANSTKADSEAFLPNQMQLVSQEQLLLGKTVFSVRQKGVPPLLLPASMQQLPRCLVRICNLFHKSS